MANDKKFIAKNGFLTSDAESSFTNSTAATPTVTFTNSGGAGASSLPGSGAVVAKFAGNSDAMVITNVSDGDYFFGNNQQNNGINFYDGSGGMEFYYNGVEKFTINSSGTTFATGHTTNGTTITNRLKVEDNGSTSPLVVIKSDDQSPWALAIGNDTYNTTEVQGHLFYQANDGTSYYQTRGNGEYVDWRFQQHNGSTARTAMNIDAGGTIELASNNYLLWGLDSTNRPGFLGDNTNKVLQFHNNGAERMRLDGSGNVGIGTQTATSGRVHVHGGNVRITADSDVGLKLRHTSATYDFNILTNSNGDLELNYGTTDFVRIKSSGNVGIGSNANNPQYKLDVDGTTRVTGGLTISPGSSGHTSFELGSRSADPLPAATGSYDFKPGMRVGSYELGGINAAADIALAWTTDDISTSSPGYLAASETYVTASWSESFTVTSKGGTRWFVKLKLNDAESGNDPRVAVNNGTEYRLEYFDAVNASGEAVNDSDTWHVIDVTDDIVTGSNVLKVWLGAGQKTYILAAYVFASTGIALPNEPAESTFYAHDGFGVRDRVIIDKNRDMTNINSVRFETPSTSGGNKNYFANVGTGGQDYWIMSTSNGNGSLGGGKFVIGTDAVSGNNAAQTRLLIDSGGNVGIGDTSPDRKLHVTSASNQVAVFETTSTADMAIELRNSQGSMFMGLDGSENFGIGTDWDLNGSTSPAKFTVTSAGDIGMGTVTPNSNLHIKSTGDVKLTLETDEDSDCWINLSGATSEASIGYEPASNSLRFANAADGVTSNIRMSIEADGTIDFKGVDGGTGDNGQLERIKSAYFVNTEDDEINTTLSQTNGARLYFDHNFYTDQTRFSDVFIGDGGGFAYYGGDQFSWTAIYDTENTKYAEGTWRNLVPTTTNTGQIGTSSKVWSNAHFTNQRLASTLYHTGDEDTYLQFGTNTWRLNAGNVNVMNGTTDDVNISRTLDLDPADNTYAINARVDATSGNATRRGFYLDMNISGNDTATADRLHQGLTIDLDSSYTGGDTSNEGRLYGAYVQSTSSGDNDMVTGGYFLGQTNGTNASASTQTTNIYGVYAQADQNRSLLNANQYGVFGYSTVDNAGATGTVNCTNSYGVYGKHLQVTGGISGTTTSAHGGYFEVESDEGVITNAYGVRAVIDRDAGTISTGYLFHGDFQGTVGTRYGWYNPDTDVTHRFGGAILATGDVTAYYSDGRLKENIEVIPNALDKLHNLRGVYYTANDLALELGACDHKDKQVGVISQEVESVLPEVIAPAPFDNHADEETGEYVNKSGNDYKTVKYERMIPLLIEAVKELSAKVDLQQQEIDRLKGL